MEDAVINDINGIGYVGVGYVKNKDGLARADIKILPVAANADASPISPLDKNAVREGQYPIFRPIYQYIPSLPTKDSFAESFLKFEASAEGQRTVQDAGFYPLTDEDARANQILFDSIK